MNKFKFDFDYIKKNLNQKNFLKDIYVLPKNSNKVSGDKYGGGDMFAEMVLKNCLDVDPNDGDDEVYNNYYEQEKNQEFKLKINKYYQILNRLV